MGEETQEQRASSVAATVDHVAVAIPEAGVAEQRWVTELGGVHLSSSDAPTFHTRQVRFAGGGKLELLAPPDGAGPDNFVRRFLTRFGAAVHHLTLTVTDLHEAVATVEGAGFDVVELDDSDPWWQEAFLRPSQVGGLLVQLACPLGPTVADAQPDADAGPPQSNAPTRSSALLGPRVQHPHPSAVQPVWELLGASITGNEAERVCSWPASPLTVTITRGAPAGPVALRMLGAPRLPADPRLGPSVEPHTSPCPPAARQPRQPNCAHPIHDGRRS